MVILKLLSQLVLVSVFSCNLAFSDCTLDTKTTQRLEMSDVFKDKKSAEEYAVAKRGEVIGYVDKDSKELRWFVEYKVLVITSDGFHCKKGT